MHGASFNTQPPKGGWEEFEAEIIGKRCFNTQPPKGGWLPTGINQNRLAVSTHSRLKAAGFRSSLKMATIQVSTHSRLKAAGNNTAELIQPVRVSTHSRLKAAGRMPFGVFSNQVCFNTQPPKGGWRRGCRGRGGTVGFNTQPPKGGWL